MLNLLPYILRAHARQLKNAFELRTALGVDEARAVLDSGAHVDVLITDYFMPDGSGVDVLVAVKKRHPRCKCYVVTGAALSELPAAAHKLADAVLAKASPELDALFQLLAAGNVGVLTGYTYVCGDCGTTYSLVSDDVADRQRPCRKCGGDMQIDDSYGYDAYRDERLDSDDDE